MESFLNAIANGIYNMKPKLIKKIKKSINTIKKSISTSSTSSTSIS